MRFFEKYQRLIFTMVTIMVVASFTAFGVFDAISHTPTSLAKADQEIAKTVTGSPIMLSEVEILSRFLSSDIGDLARGAKNIPNLCNDGVIQNDFLRTGIGAMVVAAYFEKCRPSLEGLLQKGKRYKGYEHLHAPMINSRFVWSRFLPAIDEALNALQAEESASVKTFSELARLYELQIACPPEFVRRVLSYEQKKASWVQPDPALPYVDLTLLGCHCVGDWFGSDCMDVFAEFILQGASFAESQGYLVSFEEAKGDLLHNFETALSHLSQIEGISSLSFTNHLRSLGLEEKSVVAAWRSVLLFRRAFQEMGGVVFLDTLPYREFAGFACAQGKIEKYRWPKALHCTSFQDLLELQVYLLGLGGEITQIGFPSASPCLEDVQIKMPDLVHTTYQMKISSATLDQVGLRISAKELLDWQLQTENWEMLRQEYPFLGIHLAKEARFSELEQLSSGQRAKIDLYARKAIAASHPDWIAEVLHHRLGNRQEVSVGESWISIPGIRDIAKWKNWIALPAEQRGLYSEDGITFYQCSDAEMIEPAHILTFGKAKDLGLMTVLADRYLEKEYVKIRKQYADRFQAGQDQTGKTWKLFSSVKEEVASIVLRSLLRQICSEEKPLSYYALHRLEHVSKEALFDLQYGVEREERRDPLVAQFQCTHEHISIDRECRDPWIKEEVAKLEQGAFSSICIPEDGDVSFFYLEEKTKMEEPILEHLLQAQQVLTEDAKRELAKKILSLVKQK